MVEKVNSFEEYTQWVKSGGVAYDPEILKKLADSGDSYGHYIIAQEVGL